MQNVLKTIKINWSLNAGRKFSIEVINISLTTALINLNNFAVSENSLCL